MKGRVIVITLFITAFGFSCANTAPRESRPLASNVSGDYISRLPDGETVSFAAIIGDRDDNNCVEVFIPDEYKEHQGDGKWAIPSKFVFDVPGIEKGKTVVVSGQMTFVRDSPNPRNTCNIITGRLFEVWDVK